jgi:hypothetical protein
VSKSTISRLDEVTATRQGTLNREGTGRGLLRLLEERYLITPATLQRIGALIVMWATFEADLEKVLWRLSSETPYGKVPTTEKLQISQRIARFRELGGQLEGHDWNETVELLSDVAANITAYRNAIVHGLLLPAGVGGGIALNPSWHGEVRKRSSMLAHIDERLIGIMLDALQQLMIVTSFMAYDDSPPNTNPRVLDRRQNLRKARSGTGEVRYLTDAVNSETY